MCYATNALDAYDNQGGREVKSLGVMADEVVAWAETKGWEPDPNRQFGTEMALLHSEVSEALEAYRDWGVADATKGRHDHPGYAGPCGDTANCPLPKPEGVGSEFADVLIRLLHYAKVNGIDLEAEYERKMTYNKTRAWKHGGRSL